jgi:hypothetical protein
MLNRAKYYGGNMYGAAISALVFYSVFINWVQARKRNGLIFVALVYALFATIPENP